MGFQMQSGADFVYWLSFAIIVGPFVAAVWAHYKLGGLAGRIARSRDHPQADAIGVCGWLGQLVSVSGRLRSCGHTRHRKIGGSP
jgi:hypothetical protein